MKERTIVDTMFTSMAGAVGTATEIVTKPAVELWNRLEEEREAAKRHIFRMLRLRVAKIQPYPRRLRFA